MALIYQPSKRIFCGWFEPLKSTTYSEYPKNEKCLLTYSDLQTLKNILDGKVELILGEFVGGLDYQDNLKDAQLALECLRYVKMAYDRGEKNEI